MNKICKEYISEIKTLFPIKGKQEKEYLKKLMSDIEAYCEDANVTAKEDLYQSYGKPEDVVHNYLSVADTAYIVKRVKATRYISALVIALIVLATIATSALCMYLYYEHQSSVRQEVVICNETIMEYN